MFDAEITVTILDKNENLLGFINPKHVKISETNELYKPRTITLVCQLIDEYNFDLSKYDEMLVQSNKIWKQGTTDGDSCLYVLNDEKSYNYDMTEVTIKGTEVSQELGALKLLYDDSFSWTVNSALIASTMGELYDAGDIDGPTDITTYSGILTPLQMVNEIQNTTGGEFAFRYEYDPLTDSIKRYVDFHETVGVVHEDVIRVKKNMKDFVFNTDESNVYTASGPIGTPSSSTDEFNANMLAWWNTEIEKGELINLWIKKDSAGALSYGPLAAAPYAKEAGKGWVECDEESELVALYTHIQSKAGVSGEMFRINPFTTSETHPTNIYWECVENIKAHLQPDVTLSGNIINLSKLEGLEDIEYYNIGDTVYIQLISGNVVQCRLTSTTKDPRSPASESATIKTYNSTFLQSFYQSKFKNPNSVIFS